MGTPDIVSYPTEPCRPSALGAMPEISTLRDYFACHQLECLSLEAKGEPVQRVGEAERQTGETYVKVRLALDGEGRAEVRTGIGFFDHLLHLLAHHSSVDLAVEAQGDLHVDFHHTIEDSGLVLGRAFDEALGDRADLVRFSDASAPLIEALSTAVIDLGGRSHLTCNLGPMPEKIGAFDTELFPEFLRAFTQYGRFTLHLNCNYGENAHHKVESGVKAMAVALRAGIVRRESGSASTKGVID